MVQFDVEGDVPGKPGYFRFGAGLTCYGKTTAVPVVKDWSDDLGDTLPAVRVTGGKIKLPFDPDQVADNLRYERYLSGGMPGPTPLVGRAAIRDLYYFFRPILPVPIRRVLQRTPLRRQMKNPFPGWPVDRTVDLLFEKLMELALKANGNVPIPFIWFWPVGAKAAFILTHDVETAAGVKFCPTLMDIDSEFGFRSSFQVVPEERYDVLDSFLQGIKNRGFEVNVHDLNHDGNLFRERKEFLRRVEQINQYAARFGTRGFRSGALYRQLDWFDAFDISYDMSVPSAGHLDPQAGGCCTIMPYFVGNILEIPVTAAQDYSIFHILNQYSIDLWKRQTETIIKGNGIVSIITHPDYLISKKAQTTYRQLLGYLAEKCVAENVWATLPSQIDRWWRMRHNMTLVRDGDSMQIIGEGRERARIAYATLIDGGVAYTFDPPSPADWPGPSTSPENTFEPPIVLAKMNTHDECGKLPSHDTLHAKGTVGTIALDGQIQRETLRHSELRDEIRLSCEGVTAEMALTKGEEVPTRAAGLRGSAQCNGKSQRPLRVGMVAYSFYEFDNRVMRYAETLVREGHDVEVFALGQEGSPRVEVLRGVKVYRLQSRLKNEKAAFAYASRILVFFLRSLFQVSKNDLKRKFDLVHVHSVPDFLVFAALLPRLRGTPVILDIHDILPEFYASKFASSRHSGLFRLMVAIERVSTRFANHVIIANDIWRERLISRGLSPEKCTVVLNAPDRSIFGRRDKTPSKHGKFLMLYPGSLHHHQGIDIAIRAFHKICREFPQAEFHIYGSGPAKEELLVLIRQLGIESQVKMPPPRPLQEIAHIMETADLGVVPKRNDTFGNEAFSTKIFEFMAMGVPVIVSETQVDRYYFDDSVVRFFRSGDEDDLARCMMDLIEHPEKRRTLVENASEFIAKNDWTVKKREYMELVDRLTGRS
jgi:glycosyltransferase involved in cell wall biosynthesis